jgi:hypothetical protein
MSAAGWTFVAYAALSLYDLGMTWVLQLMHYPLYHQVGAAEFPSYMRANNARAALPAILPALATLAASLLLLWRRPPIVTEAFAWSAVVLNLVVVISTAIWQGRLHAQLARSGKSETAIDLLVRTNWIRTMAFTVQALLVIWMLAGALAERV